MTYVIQYEADFQCPWGHRYIGTVRADSAQTEQICPYCWANWLDRMIPKGLQVTEPRPVSQIKPTHD